MVQLNLTTLLLFLSFPALGSQFAALPENIPLASFSSATSTSSALPAFFGKVFEDSGPLGKGITVGKVQVALQARDRSQQSIFGFLEKQAAAARSASTSAQLSRLAHETCLALLRRSDEWTAACSDSAWFSQKDAVKAESKFNDWANREAYKFEKVRP